MSTVPHIGIFWRIADAGTPPSLLVDSVPVNAGEPYGEFLTYGGHYDFWCGLSRMTAHELRQRHLSNVASWSEYEEWPRGRVVFHMPTSRYTVYADRKLQEPAMISLILQRFGLSKDQADVRSDPHYISVR